MRKLLIVGVPFAASVALFFGCVGCTPAPPTDSKPKVEPAIDVHWASLFRDFITASSYRGRRIRVRLEPAEFDVVAARPEWEIRVWAGDRAAPPVLVFVCDESPPHAAVVVTGTCNEPVRDGIWRSPRVDYYLMIIDCRVLRR